MRALLLPLATLVATLTASAQIEQGDVSICEGEHVTLSIAEPEGASNAFSNSNSLDFGSGDFVRIPIAPELADFSEVTIEFWYYQISRGEEFIVATEYFNTGWGFHNENPNVLQWRVEGGPYSLGGSNFPIPYNEWMHVAGVYDGSELRLYANGTLVASEAYSGTISDSRNEDIVINRHVWASGSSSRLTGQLDELRISNVARYDGDFTPPAYAFEPDVNTLALYHFDEASGSMVEDASGNGHNGNTSGTSWSANLPFSSGSTTSTPDILWSTGETTSSISLTPASIQTVSVAVSGSSDDFTDEVTVTVEPCTPDLPDHVPLDGLVAWYPFNGNANDESGNGHDGIITGATFAEDRNGNADASIEFNGYPVPGTNRTQVGLDNHVYVPDFDDPFDNGLSISLWALEFPTSESAFLQRRNNNNIDFNLELNTSNQIAAHLGFTAFSSQETMPSEQWTHLTLSYDEESIKLYKDGALIEEQAATQGINNFADELFIGKYIYYGGFTHHFFFNGRQDDLGIWNRALTLEEIEALADLEPSSDPGDASSHCAVITSSEAQADVVARIVVPISDGMAADAADVQLVMDGTPLPHWIGQTWTDSAEFFVRMTTLDSGTNALTALFGEGYSHVNDGTAVFDVFDDFDGSSMDDNLWTSSIQSGASMTFSGGEMILNVTQTDNYVSLYTDEAFDLNDNWAFLTRCRTQDNRGHTCVSFGSGFDAPRLAAGGYAQYDGYGFGEGHHNDWGVQLGRNGQGLGASQWQGHFGTDEIDSDIHASWKGDRYQIRVDGELEVDIADVASLRTDGTYPFFIWLNAWDGNNRSMWVDYAAAFQQADISVSWQGTNCVQGCTDATACNYNADATCDDGSCIPSGCMEEDACNYNALAQCEGEACDYTCCPGPGCCSDGTTWDSALSQCTSTTSNAPSAASCGAGTHWDPVTEMCIADVPGTTDENCTVMNLQELAEGYQVLLDHTANQDSIILAQQTTIDALDAVCGCSAPVSYQGHDYEVVEIGDQCWFAENLQSASYRNGDAIPTLPNNGWSDTANGAQAAFDNDEANVSTYGRLYNWHSVNDTRPLCPSGWHVPDDDDWQVLIDGIGAQGGLQLKATSGWTAGPNGTDAHGFDGRPAGYRSTNGVFANLGALATWWSATPNDNGGDAHVKSLIDNSNEVYQQQGISRQQGRSIRCLKN